MVQLDHLVHKINKILKIALLKSWLMLLEEQEVKKKKWNSMRVTQAYLERMRDTIWDSKLMMLGTLRSRTQLRGTMKMMMMKKRLRKQLLALITLNEWDWYIKLCLNNYCVIYYKLNMNTNNEKLQNIPYSIINDKALPH